MGSWDCQDQHFYSIFAPSLIYIRLPGIIPFITTFDKAMNIVRKNPFGVMSIVSTASCTGLLREPMDMLIQSRFGKCPEYMDGLDNSQLVTLFKLSIMPGRCI